MISWTKYLSEAPAVCADTPSPFHKSHTAADILKTLECTRCLRQSDVILFRFHHKDLFKYRIHTEICPMAGLETTGFIQARNKCEMTREALRRSSIIDFMKLFLVYSGCEDPKMTNTQFCIERGTSLTEPLNPSESK